MALLFNARSPSFHLPLSFDRVNEGRPLQSISPLFNLPFEILGNILQHMPSNSLASLAFVNRDCRQLARSRQFSRITFDYSESSLELLACLFSEWNQRTANAAGSTLLPSIGSCIRTVRIAAVHGNWIDDWFESYLPCLQNILSQHFLLPHLDAVELYRIGLTSSFFNTLIRSSIRHLKLLRVHFKGNFHLTPPSTTTPHQWPLQTLTLEGMEETGIDEEVDTTALCASLFRICAPSLESLSWGPRRIGGDDEHSFAADGLGLAPRFASLRQLRLGRLNFRDTSFLDAFIHNSIRVLDACTEFTPIQSDFFRERGTMPCLETFVWGTSQLSPDHPLDFLRKNTQLSKLCLLFPGPVELLEGNLLPLLSQSFSRLTSLSLKWPEEVKSISEKALGMIGTLKSLKQICISAGIQHGDVHDWLINHTMMRKYLREIPGLEKIAFSRDTYENGWDWSSPENYYQHRSTRFPTSLDNDGALLESIWEEKHRKRMLEEAKGYLRRLPELKWLLIGQIPIAIKRRAKGTRFAVALSERDECPTLLRSMFGGSTD